MEVDMKKTLVFVLLIALTFSFAACDLFGNPEGEHKHSFSTAWTSDDTHHWHVANCEHTDEISDKAAHEFENGYCKVCDAEDKSSSHQHRFATGWTSNDTHHWYAATCQHTDQTSNMTAHSFDSNGRCTVCYALKTSNSDGYPYEFGDVVSVNNNAYYKDYSAEEKQLYYILWSEKTTVSIQIDITPYELAKINEAFTDYSERHNSLKADTYRKCNLTIIVNGVKYYYEEVGIRMRGNTSRRYFIGKNGNIDSFVHFRFSLSETFDGEEYEGDAWGNEIYHDWSDDADGRKERKDRSFATMEKFYYKWNKNYDQTYIREVYANRMFQAYGILAPHITLTQMSISQNSAMENFGVGNLYETVDKAFIKRNFSKARKGGDLYKCTYANAPANLSTYDGGVYGVETPTQNFTYSLKTNDDRNDPDYTHNAYLKAFIDMLKTNKDSSDFKTKLEAMVDMDYFARFEAVNYLLGNPDCIRNNANNYYLYFVPVSDGDYTKSNAYLIPYDYDRCLGADMDWNPNKDSMVNAKPYDTKGVITCNNPLYTKTILNGGLTEYKQLYTSKLQQVLNGDWFKYANYKAMYDAYKANYSSVAMPSQLIQSQCGKKVKMSRFVFSETESSEINRSDVNLTVSVYFQMKRATATSNLD